MGRAAQILDNLIEKGLAEPMIVVMPNGNPNQAAARTLNIPEKPMDWRDPAFRDAYVKSLCTEIVPFIEKNFRAIAKPSSRAIAGLSMGGWGTLYYGLKYPTMFTYGYAMSPATSLSWYPVSLGNLISAQPDKSVFPFITLESGTQDYTVSIESVRNCDQLLMSYDIPHQFIERAGGHDWNFWPECLKKALVAIGNSFK